MDGFCSELRHDLLRTQMMNEHQAQKYLELSKEVDQLTKSTGGISENQMMEIMGEMKTKFAKLETDYSENMAKKESELELANSKVHNLRVKVEALTKGAEAASSAYSGEGTEGHQNMSVMEKFKAEMEKMFDTQATRKVHS